jgi:hypothetical protein
LGPTTQGPIIQLQVVLTLTFFREANFAQNLGGGPSSDSCKKFLTGDPYYSTIYPNSRTPSSLAWVQRTHAGLRPNPHISWPLATTILQCAASLAAGRYDRPCGPNESLFLLITREANNSRPNYTAPSCPNSRTPSSLAWVQRTQAGLRPNPHISWPSATTILQCAASLAPGSYNRPCGPIGSLFLLITRGADNSRPNFTAPSCPTEQLSYSFISRVDFRTLSEGGAHRGFGSKLGPN